FPRRRYALRLRIERGTLRNLPEITGCIGRIAALHSGAGSRNIGGMVIRLSDDKKPPTPPKRDGERQTGLVLDERTRTKKPPMYKVLLHNDDYTTREFVVWVLQTVFHKNEGDAIAIMSHVHNNGVGVAGVYTFEVAETKVTKTTHLAKAQQFPLQLSIEPTD
ncbi:MAG TPA: ATP-dependent Clp protease adaptor ClpS, partial [Kofleriaceae bacterium]|nr:ATP-dependent Clp protease adaptor ClpS [Kofleriaceae bacterium]